MATQAEGKAKTSSSIQVKQFENLKTLLKNVKSSQGQDLYQHIQEVFKQLVLHYPDQALEKLEEVSYLLKHQSASLNINDFLLLEENRSTKEHSDALQEYISKLEAHFSRPKGDEEGEEPAEPGPINNVPDLLGDSKVYEWAGIGFGEQETYRIQKSLKKLVQESGAGNVMFFGKIYGTE